MIKNSPWRRQTKRTSGKVDAPASVLYRWGVKVIRWIIQNALALLIIGGIVAYFGYTQIKGKCPLCVVLEKIDRQTSAAGK